jgi:TRAP-type mannitol/chloroaromatic compound transport system permease small subunit
MVFSLFIKGQIPVNHFGKPNLSYFSILVVMIFRYLNNIASFSLILLVMLVCSNVCLRYILNDANTAMIELEWHLFGLVFLLSGAWVYLNDKHVRVDVVYEKLPVTRQHKLDFIGDLFFLIPWAAISAWTAKNYFLRSYVFSEGSPDPGGLPARFIIKGVICIAFISLLFAVLHKLISNIVKRSPKS